MDRNLAAHMAFYAMYAEDMFSSIKMTNPHGTPQLDAHVDYGPPLSGADWNIAGEIRCTDTLGILGTLFNDLPFHFDTGEYFYGFLLKRRTPGGPVAVGDYVAIIRGTQLTAEWIMNTEITMDPFALKTGVVAYVPRGFHTIYKSMVLVTPAGRAPAAAGIAQIVGNAKLSVVGHSLGSALGTYLAYDLATYPMPGGAKLNVYAWLFASPHPGDRNFSEGFYAAMPDYDVINWDRDAVPQVPPLPYVPVPSVFQLTLDNVTIEPWNPVDLACNHNLLSYARMLDPTLVTSDPTGCFTPPKVETAEVSTSTDTG